MKITNKKVETFVTHSMEFDGDIIITDPCYVIKDSDWGKSNWGSNMESLGINHYIVRDTLYGDWGCTTFNSDSKEKIGEFCADVGLVAVFLLDEVLKYNPDFDYHIYRPWTTTWINDFSGTVEFIIRHVQGKYGETTKWYQEGDKYEDQEVQVVGNGVNKKTGEPIRFVSKQTGF